MKVKPLICDACKKPMTLGQWMVVIETDDAKLIVHRSNPKVWGRGQKPKTCFDVMQEKLEKESK